MGLIMRLGGNRGRIRVACLGFGEEVWVYKVL